MTNAFADLLGAEPEDDFDPGTEYAPPAPSGKDFRTLKPSHVHELDRGVTINWLAQAFLKPRKDVEKLLARCPILRMGPNSSKIYDFRVAAAFMVPPRVSVKDYIKNLEPKDLPERLRSEFWSARLKEQKARLIARELWRSEDVQAAFGDVLKLIKDTVLLWTDTVEESSGITDEQRAILDELSRDLLARVGDSIDSYCTGSAQFPSQESELEDGGEQ
ncbi:hypothetical protein D2N39_11735 [Gemmobacter lutimaris]|uniref:DUF1441 family protein n=1 Tax=Gemmobacter lutimaris TaxID=2306023 RepID=A0A398BMG1_9RHOB|nr:hypothetical protein [Gemmobacter lutimaris]RID91899.1 hypothetical protein D2N39_11735 [Gemmobacter lutimaris]